MHGLITVTLALAGLAVHALAHSVPPYNVRRKTLGFGPDLPHARFESAVDVHLSAAVDATKDAYVVARDFLSPYRDFQAGRTYVIRPDSYTDHATGVTHIYARQIIGGIEVANAHVNLNIKDGRVLSFGDSVRALTPRPVFANLLTQNHSSSLQNSIRMMHIFSCTLTRTTALSCLLHSTPTVHSSSPL